MWFIRDGCGIACAIVTWFLVLYAEFVVLFVMLIPSRDYVYSVINGLVFNLLAFLALASHCRAMLTDPACHWSLSCRNWNNGPHCGMRLLVPSGVSLSGNEKTKRQLQVPLVV
uniref:Uncharacterized protein n=1 Tax=Rangifer tarandus platyrhynchus TaxID=3082113 RepID=A0ACB0EHG2_RANTA|nr:unnamed protein product [Rangifer tarandus platyrhynchus]